MKKILILIFIFCSASSYGGNTKPKRNDPKVKFGVEAGLNFPKFIWYPNQLHPFSYPKGMFAFELEWHTGIYANIKLSNKIDFCPELEYSVKGSRINLSNSINAPRSVYYVRFNYFEMPLQLKYNFNQHFSIIYGIYYSLLTKMYSSYDPNYNFDEIRKNYKKYDVGFVLGLGFKISNGFNFAIKYSQGVVPLGHKYVYGLRSYSGSNLVLSVCAAWDIKW